MGCGFRKQDLSSHSALSPSSETSNKEPYQGGACPFQHRYPCLLYSSFSQHPPVWVCDGRTYLSRLVTNSLVGAWWAHVPLYKYCSTVTAFMPYCCRTAGRDLPEYSFQRSWYRIAEHKRPRERCCESTKGHTQHAQKHTAS